MCVHTKRAWLHGVSPKGFCSLSLSLFCCCRCCMVGLDEWAKQAYLGKRWISQDTITLKVPMCIYSIFLAQFLLLLLSRHVRALPTHVLGKREGGGAFESISSSSSSSCLPFPLRPPFTASPFYFPSLLKRECMWRFSQGQHNVYI